MALFDENMTVAPAPRRSRPRSFVVGVWALTVAVVALLVLSFLPTGYVIQRPGPVYNTLGTTQDGSGDEVPLISIPDARTYPTDGALYLLTVQVVGNRTQTPSWMQLVEAWFDPARAVMPIDAVFPDGQSTQERDEASTAMMVDSQKEATAAALIHLGYDVHPSVTVHTVVDGSPAEGVLEPGDVILAVDGQAVTDVDSVRASIQDAAGAAVTLDVDRDGTRRDVRLTPEKTTAGGQTQWIIGVVLTTDFAFPIDVHIQLNNVGGPSAGMMFALGIIDTLTPGELNGGKQVAGTGTIDAEGEVGPIGGIRQKLYGARGAGARYFLAPKENCGEVVGHVPAGMRVFAVSTLDDALHALDAVRTGEGMDALPTCKAG